MASDKNIKRISETRSNISAYMGADKIAIESDGSKRMVYKDADGTLRTLANIGETGLFGRVVQPNLANAQYVAADADGKLIKCNFAGITGLQASSVSYNNTNTTLNIDDVQEALDYILTEPGTIDLTIDPATADKGETVNTVDATWDINRINIEANYITELSSQGGTLTGATGLGYTGLGLTADQAFNVYFYDTVRGETGTDQAYLRFKLNKFYGTTTDSTPDEADIEAGTSVSSIDTASSRSLSSVSINGGGDYIFYAYPAAWGDVNLTVNGFASVWNKTTISNVNNGSGNTEDYYCYTSPNTITGTITLVAAAA